jgi:hypothetical protein
MQNGMAAMNEALELLRLVKRHEDSAFFGLDAEKNRRAQWRGIMRKIRAMVAEVEEEK